MCYALEKNAERRTVVNKKFVRIMSLVLVACLVFGLVATGIVVLFG